MDSALKNGIELAAGTKISFYEVLPSSTDAQGDAVRTCVGYGGFGALYRVARGSRVYALKLAHRPLSSYSAEERRWMEASGDREVATLKALNHPNIVRVHAFDRWPDEDGRAFLVMEFIEGDPLDVWRSKASPSLRRICDVFIQIARGLHAAHEQRVHHRDVKPANVLVPHDGGPVKIVDWGIAKPLLGNRVTQVGVSLGTYTHYAPEYCRWQFMQAQPAGKREPVPYDPNDLQPATELHSVGHMFYELLTGRGPFNPGLSELEMATAIINEVPQPPSAHNRNVPPELDAVVLRLLAKDPADRHQTGEDLAKELEELLARAPSTWDSPLDVPLAAPSQSSTRVERLSRNPSRTPRSAVASTLELDQTGFVEVEKVPAAAPKSTAGAIAPSLPSKIAAAKASVEAAGKRRVSPLAITGGVVVLLVLGLIVLSAAAKTAASGKPRDLLAAVAARADHPGVLEPPDAGLAPEPQASLVPPGPQGEVAPAAAPAQASAREAAPSAAPPTMPTRAASPSDAAGIQREAAAIQREIEAKYGRPTLPPNPSTPPGREAVPREPKPRQKGEQLPDWLKPLKAEDDSAVATDGLLGIATGTHLRVRLLTNLDSRTITGGPVEARLVRGYAVDGRVVLPGGTMLIGNASTSGSRFEIRIFLARLPDRRELRLEGLAYDITEKKPGLPATRRIEPGGGKGDSTSTRIARGAANTLIDAAAGPDLGTALAAGASRTIVNERNDDAPRSSTGNVLLLDAPTDFEVFVTKAL